ncbi:RETRotransposon-like family member, partial [Reticulomyxa filosa]
MFEDIDDVDIYIDDLIVSMETEQQHIHSTQYEIGNGKCEFLQRKLVFLGHVISADGIGANPQYVEKILKINKPCNKKQLEQLLGLVQWIARFIPNCKWTAELSKLRKKNTKWKWDSTHEDAFTQLKKAIKNTQLLRHPKQSDPFIVHCDASDVAVGAALLQIHDVVLVPIEFISKKFDKHQLNWHTSEKELYSVIYALQKWRHYLLLRKFTVYTDHKNLESLFAVRSKQ